LKLSSFVFPISGFSDSINERARLLFSSLPLKNSEVIAQTKQERPLARGLKRAAVDIFFET
jgi:hypothetical protein